jgi:purine nucleosidase/pyrimidine-specific ribonucleoside hydrolase
MIPGRPEGSQLPRPALIDTDPGIDDALALYLAWGSPALRLEAISTVAGNVDIDLATVNAARLLEAAAPPHRPLMARGAPAPLHGPLITAAHVHGADGLGNVGRLVRPNGAPRYPRPRLDLETRDGADLILDMADRFGDSLLVVALGPLTNLALALQRGPERARQIGRVVVMGGAVIVPGNVTPAAEFNFFVDPEAAAAVLAAGLSLDLVPLDVTRRVVLRRAALETALGTGDAGRGRLLQDLAAHGFQRGAADGEGGIVLHDPLAVALAADPSLAVWRALPIRVETDAGPSRGRSAAGGTGPPCRVALEVDAPRALTHVLEGLCRACA